MKKWSSLLTAYALIIFAISAYAQVSVSALGLATAPNDVLRYSGGLGLRVGLYPEHIYLGASLVFHHGSETSTYYDARPGFPAGSVVFKSNPVLLAHDMGYEVIIPVRGKQTVLIPYLSYGIMAFVIKSSQLYGTHSHMKTSVRGGLGIMYHIRLTSNLSAGLHYRWYPFRDRQFQFVPNDADIVPSYGFSSSIRYSAIGLELVYKLNSLSNAGEK